MPGVKQPHERGEVGAWLVEQRKRLGEERGVRVTQQMVVDELRDQGHILDASYYRAIESGAKKPGREIREALGRYFGRTPPSPSAGSQATDLTRVIAAMEAQTAAMREQTAVINRLVDRLGDSPDPSVWEPLARLAAQLVTAPSIGEDEALPEQPHAEAPPGEAEPQRAGMR